MAVSSREVLALPPSFSLWVLGIELGCSALQPAYVMSAVLPSSSSFQTFVVVVTISVTYTKYVHMVLTETLASSKTDR